MAIVAEEPTGVQDLAWREAVTRVNDLAHGKLPVTLHNRIQMATALLLDHGVFVDEDSPFTQVKGGKDGVWYLVKERERECQCQDHAPQRMCKHVLAAMMYQRASELLRHGLPTVDGPIDQPARIMTVEDTDGIDPRFIVKIKGKPFVIYDGLLLKAKAEGLVILKAKLISVTSEMALAKAMAAFKDGRIYVEAADATPANCGPSVRIHYPRVALTRAKGRCLRDALNIGLCTLEEIEDEPPY